MAKYSLGIDFGTLSARAVIVNIETKEEIASSTHEYKHGVITENLPENYALQHPADYIEALYFIIKNCIEKSSVNPSDIVGVGVDFTSCTILPVDENGTPLCFLDEFKDNPHAYVKLWKHHAAQKEADEITNLAKETNAPWLEQYGGTTSCEGMFPKILEILKADEILYNKTHRFIEAGNWIVWLLTGKETHSVCATGFKAIWNEKTGYPDKEFLKKLDPRLENIVGTKLSTDIKLLSETAGYITKEIADKTGLIEGTPVSPPFIDAHAALPALGVTKPGELLLILGTSSCHIALSDKEMNIPGICGYVKNGIIDGLYAFEAGQPCVGDCLNWFVENCTPHAYYVEAEKEGVSIHQYLTDKAKKLSLRENALVALDWWNGSRTPYVNANLSGMILGLNLATKPEEIYRALIEATAYGTKRIIDIYEENGIEINKVYATGGIAEKNELFMQIYSDVTGKEIFLSDTPYGCAYGSAVLGATHYEKYGSLPIASEKMKKIKPFTYKPNPENTEIYQKLYKKYVSLSEYFAKGE